MTAPELVVVETMGVAVGIPVPDDATAARLRHQWSRAVTDRPAEVLVEDLPDPADPVAHDYALTVLVTLTALRATAGQRLNIHAGAVADTEGRALAVVGESGSGKTTAVRALAGRLGYLSDETVSLTEDLAVHPHPKPLSVITDPSRPRDKASVSPDDAGLVVPPQHASLRRVVLLRRGHGTHGLEPVGTAEAMVEIVPQTSSLTQLEHPLLTLASAIDRCGGAFGLHYDEVVDHLDELVDLLAEEIEAPEPPEHHPASPPVEPSGDQWARTPWLDAVQYGDELVVMVGDVAHLLGGIGTTVWLTLSAPATVDEVVAATVAEHGPHPQAGALVEEALASLLGSGLVVAPSPVPPPS
ncbi:hypothetical protein [Nocardioides currus]|uniref:Uncharacterized protein n=1 Tax=Nocardioides currus TaxID=2133958 RepID=A0A2R7YYR1_9ACTN|nr:hypothetical protein [Nocardioides currus]PUA81515.1 hypothetical protein C7S10_05385 [Nocardioides currus]